MTILQLESKSVAVCLLPSQKDLLVNFPHSEKLIKTTSYFCNEHMFWIMSPALSFSITKPTEGLSFQGEQEWLAPYSALVDCLCIDSSMSFLIHLFDKHHLLFSGNSTRHCVYMLLSVIQRRTHSG